MRSLRKTSSAIAVLGVTFSALLFAGFGLLIVRAQRLPEGPVEVTWDREACAHCRMHIGERAFAGQLQLRDGRVLNFDDPGCLLRHLEATPVKDVHATYFHHSRQERWVTRSEVAFVETQPTPMGFGLAAVHQGTPGAVSYEEARRRVLRPNTSREEHSSW